MVDKKKFIYCEKCGKKLIEQMPNGIFKFIFGGRVPPPVVEMYICGSIKMKCLRKSCGYFNEISFLPNVFNRIQSD